MKKDFMSAYNLKGKFYHVLIESSEGKEAISFF